MKTKYVPPFQLAFGMKNLRLIPLGDTRSKPVFPHYGLVCQDFLTPYGIRKYCCYSIYWTFYNLQMHSCQYSYRIRPVTIHYGNLSSFTYLDSYFNPVNNGTKGKLNTLFTRKESIGKKKEPIGKIYDDILGKEVTIYRIPGKEGIFFKSKMHVDADGAYWAYHPKDRGKKCNEYADRPEKWKGFECMLNAGTGKAHEWWALVMDEKGNPVVQKATDPAPGYYVSSTTLEERSIPNTKDPKRYVDSETIPYFVLPAPAYKNWKSEGKKIKVGDLGVIINQTNGKMAFAIFADVWPRKKNIGEGSMYLACALGFNRNPRTDGGTGREEIIYIIFPESGKGSGKLRTLEEINEEGRRLFEKWGGVEQAKAILSLPDPITIGTCSPTLRKGENGEFVKKLQQSLKTLKFYTGEINGIFGEDTEEAVKNFQHSNNLTVNGIVDLTTWDNLAKP